MQQDDQFIRVLELRNYLLKPGLTNAFIQYFNAHFVTPMNELGGYTLGQFTVSEASDRFAWLRGFANMDARLTFLEDFYGNSAVWKTHGPGANEMMINSDNVYLLRPLNEADAGIDIQQLKTTKGVVVVDFFICNSTLDKTIALFKSSYLAFLASLEIHTTTLWVSEMAENKFPRLPAFQDKNLLLTITTYETIDQYQSKQEQLHAIPAALKMAILELVTIQSSLVLYPATSWQPAGEI